LDNDSEIKEAQRTNNILLVIGITEKHHPVEVLNDIEMFHCLGAGEGQPRLDDDLAKDSYLVLKQH
jgi:hypothetical protein